MKRLFVSAEEATMKQFYILLHFPCQITGQTLQ